MATKRSAAVALAPAPSVAIPASSSTSSRNRGAALSESSSASSSASSSSYPAEGSGFSSSTSSSSSSTSSSYAPIQGVALLSRKAVDARAARRLLRNIAKQELDILSNNTNSDKSHIHTLSYQSAVHLERARQEAISYINTEATREATEAVTTTTTAKDPSLVIETGSKTLREWGVNVNADSTATTTATTSKPQDESSTSSTSSSSSPALLTLHDNLYRGRPLKGATTAALYIAAETEVGYPPKIRNQWRYPGGHSGSTMTSPHAREAIQTLKRPAFPDRAHIHGQTGAGTAELRAVALAAHFDDAAALEERVERMHKKALRATMKV